jgi:hypothetical protein
VACAEARHAEDLAGRNAEIEGFRRELGAMIATMTRLTSQQAAQACM